MRLQTISLQSIQNDFTGGSEGPEGSSGLAAAGLHTGTHVCVSGGDGGSFSASVGDL